MPAQKLPPGIYLTDRVNLLTEPGQSNFSWKQGYCFTCLECGWTSHVYHAADSAITVRVEHMTQRHDGEAPEVETGSRAVRHRGYVSIARSNGGLAPRHGVRR